MGQKMRRDGAALADSGGVRAYDIEYDILDRTTGLPPKPTPPVSPYLNEDAI